MWQGTTISIHLAESAGAMMRPVDAVRAVAGRGLEGDRYYAATGFYSDRPAPLREVSLIEEETLEALARDHNLRLESGVTRRNIVTRGVPLNHLVNRNFQVGEAIFRGVKLCEPCGHVVDVTGIRGLLPNLIHRGGLHAAIVRDGLVQVGDTVKPLEDG